MIKKILRNAVVQNAGWMIAGRVIQMIISLFVGVITARYLGPNNYGLINYAGAYTAFFTSICTLGTNAILLKELVQHPEKEGELLGSNLLMRGIASIMSAICIVAIVSLVDAGEKITISVTALCSLGLIFHIFDVYRIWFQAKLKSKYSAMIALIAYIVTAAYRIILLILRKSVIWFAFATSVDYICIAILYIVCYYHNGGKKLSVSLAAGKDMVRQGYHFILSGMMVAVYGQTDKLMLKQMLGETEVGYYATATALCTMWCFVLTAIIESFHPSIIAAHKTDKDCFERRNKQLYAIVFYISAFVSLCFCLFGGFAINLLYGKEFAPAVKPLRVVTWYTAFSYLGVARNAWLVCEGKQKYLKYIYFAAAICNVLLNIPMISAWGATGAAVASLITQILTSIVLPFFIKPLRSNSILMVEAILLKGVRP